VLLFGLPNEKVLNGLFVVVVVVVDDPKVLLVAVVFEVPNEKVVVVFVLSLVVEVLKEKPTGFDDDEVVLVFPKVIVFEEAFEPNGFPNPKVGALLLEF